MCLFIFLGALMGTALYFHCSKVGNMHNFVSIEDYIYVQQCWLLSVRLKAIIFVREPKEWNADLFGLDSAGFRKRVDVTPVLVRVFIRTRIWYKTNARTTPELNNPKGSTPERPRSDVSRGSLRLRKEIDDSTVFEDDFILMYKAFWLLILF